MNNKIRKPRYFNTKMKQKSFNIKDAYKPTKESIEKQIKRHKLYEYYGIPIGVFDDGDNNIYDVDDIKGEDLKDIKDELKEMGVSKKKVKKAKEVEVEMTMREKGASKDDEDTQSLSIIVVKIGRNWYVANMDNFF